MTEIRISIKPEYIRECIKEIFNREQCIYNLGNVLDIYSEKELIDDLVEHICRN